MIIFHKQSNFIVQFYVGGMFLNSFAKPITPHANLAPAFPVFFDY